MLIRIALKQQTVGVIALALLVASGGVLNTLAFVQIAGTTPAERAAFAQQMTLLGAQLSYMLPVPVRIDTLAGYLEWRWFGTLVVVFGIWAAISASGSGRGDEERGLVEQWLAAGVGRARYLITRVAVFAAIAIIVIGTMQLSILLSADGEPLVGRDLFAMGLNLLATTLCCYGLALVIAQLVTTRRGAGGIAAGLLIGLFLLNGAGRTTDIGPVRWLSPFYYFERSRPLTDAGSLDVGAVSALLGAAVLLITIGIVTFARRDLGGTALPGTMRDSRASRSPSRDPLLRLPVLGPLRQQRIWVASWLVGFVVLAAALTSITRTIVDSLTSSAVPFLRAYFERAGLSVYDSFVGVIWLSTATLLLSIYAIVQVASWSADDAEGRLATILSAPVSHGRVILERLATLLVAVALIAAASSVAVCAVAAGQGIRLDGGRVALAAALLLTIPFAFGSIGQFISASRPRIAVVALSTVAVFSYFVQQFVPLFGWPEWVANLSLYTLYGMPMSGEIRWGGVAGLVGIGAVATAASLMALRRRDIGA
ncbi:MAG TPA: ABC transporter permease subunit [Candidatus Limnocylindria bacterium]|jgi:ABC-2 type transport system permease protein|nr:ABC transporter permease subunit [Candidatus Limnocylindria bacterium]